ncbi:cytochrome P450 [Mycena floridula]|nr:cytochrome P450 [Mycena floridula]
MNSLSLPALQSVPLTIALVLGSVIVLLFLRLRGQRNLSSLPPGPPAQNWLLGTKLLSAPYLQYEEWANLYGPVFSLRQGLDTMVVIARYDAAVDIMEKEGVNMADRPRSIAAGEVLSGGLRTLLIGDGPRIKKLRKALHSHLQAKVAGKYEPIQWSNAKNFIRDILNDPENHQDHAKRYAASVIMTLAYGKTTSTLYSDPEVRQINEYTRRLGVAARPGSYLVDAFPLLRYVPFYLSTLRSYHREELALFRSQLEAVRSKMVSEESVQPCFATHVIENQVHYDLSSNEAAYLVGSMFGAGSETTAAAISIVVIAAACFPSAQDVVQKELDANVGFQRCPSFEDKLPQVTAFYLECYRWRPVSATGFPHRTTKDIIWRDYRIPAGTTVVGSHWSIYRSPEIFPNPEKFEPQRWIDGNGNIREDLKNFNFGFGRRICPGLQVANRSLFINTALLLWAFRVSEDPLSPIDTMAFTPTANMQPLPFKARFEPRLGVDELKRAMAEG